MRQRGFTVIELMIATLVFSVMMIIITTAVISFSRQYYRGTIQSNTQGTARAIIDDISRSIQFNTGEVYELKIGGTTRGYCVGDSKRYSFMLNRKVVSGSPDAGQHESNHGLVSDTSSGCTSTLMTPLDVTALGNGPLAAPNARELLGAHMRLTKFSIDKNLAASGTFYTIKVKVVYGDDDLLTDVNDPDMQCKGGSGGEYCAVSELTTTVKKRVD